MNPDPTTTNSTKAHARRVRREESLRDRYEDHVYDLAQTDTAHTNLINRALDDVDHDVDRFAEIIGAPDYEQWRAQNTGPIGLMSALLFRSARFLGACISRNDKP